MLKLWHASWAAKAAVRLVPSLNVNILPPRTLGSRKLFSTTFSGVSVSKLDQSMYPNAPIRKFFEEQTIAFKRDGSPNNLGSGRPWFASELRLKSFEDLHKLHFVLLVERTKLLNEKVRCRKTSAVFPSPERIRNVKLSMARLQTVLSERARESAQMKAQQVLENPEAALKSKTERVMSEAEKKWHTVHRKMKKPDNHIPSPPKASGGNKTRRKMQLAKNFEKDTLEYIRAIRKPTAAPGENAAEVKKPRWRNLSQSDVLLLREKQKEVRNRKVGRILKAQAKQKAALAKQNQRQIKEERVPPTNRIVWPERPELSTLILRKKEKDKSIVSRSVKGRKNAEKRRLLVEKPHSKSIETTTTENEK